MTPQQPTPDQDPSAVSRKQDHIEMAFKSRVEAAALDPRFFYEPMLSGHPLPGSLPVTNLLGKTLRAPIWVSSMTGGTEKAGRINHHLARACGQFGMGMGLGSCRQLLYSDEYLKDFDVRDTMGSEAPLLANLGVAQVEKLFRQGAVERIPDLLHKLRADGLMLHINPLQEAMQPEGDFFDRPPLETLQDLLETYEFPIVVKEVGQGFGPKSLKSLLKMPLAALEFAAAGGTNFAKLELLRSNAQQQEVFAKIATVGHSAVEMLGWVNALVRELGPKVQTQSLILSGGVSDFLEGYYLLQKASLPAVYGQASGFLKYAQEDYATLEAYVAAQIRGLELANAFLVVR